MIELFCQSDIDKFKENSPYPKVFADYLQARFLELKRCMEEFFEEEGEFNLKEFGHMAILEKSACLIVRAVSSSNKPTCS